MFGLEDLDTFAVAFFVVLPAVTFIHELGHLFFACLAGCRRVRLRLGIGRPLTRLGIVEIRRIWFWSGCCDREALPRGRTGAQLAVCLGGPAFSVASLLLLYAAVSAGWVKPGPLTWQFSYFTFYCLFFALLPVRYPDGSASDGRRLLDLIREARR